MDSKLLLLQSICLLFRETQLEKKNNDSKELVKEVLSTVKIPETQIEGDQYRETIVSLRSTTEYLLEQSETNLIDRDMLLQRIRVNVGTDVGLYKAFDEHFKKDMDQAEIKLTILRYRDDLKCYLREHRIRDIIKKHYTKLHFGTEKINWSGVVDEITTELEPLRCGLVGAIKPWVVDDIDFANLEALEDVVQRSLEENGSEGMLRCGWHGVNSMLGGDTYYRRGDFVVGGGLQHNFKTGFILNHLKHFALYNKPYMIDPAKKPMLLFITSENSVKDNLMWMYINLKENETGEPCETRGVKPKDVAKYVMDRLTANGYHIKMMRVDPTDFTYRDLFDIVLQLEADGYEIHACLFDYLNMISKKGCTQGPMGSDVRDLFRRVRNFMSPRGILFMTPHQLSSEAKSLLRSGVSPEDFVKEIANKGYWDSCRVIDQEVDLELYFHIVKKDGVSYLTIQRGKHRKPTITAETYLYTVLRFHPVGGIRDDVEGEDTSLRKVGGKRRSETSETESNWYDV